MDKYPLKTIISAMSAPADPFAFSRAFHAALSAMHDKNIPKNQKVRSLGQLETYLHTKLKASAKKGINKTCLAERRAFVYCLSAVLKEREKLAERIVNLREAAKHAAPMVKVSTP